MTNAHEVPSELVTELQRQFQLLEDARAKTEGITAKATARDGSVAVEASAAGHIVGVEIITASIDRAALGAAIKVCANQALQAAREAAEERMADFYEAQTAAVDELTDRTGIDVTGTVHRESHPPAIPEHLRTDDAYRRSRD